MTISSGTRPTFSQVKAILSAGTNAGHKALELGQRRAASPAVAYAAQHGTRTTNAQIDDVVDHAIRAHVALARSEGAAAGLATTTAEAGVVVENVGVIPVIATITITDLTALAWIQLRMVLVIAALYGHDPHSPVRLREFMSLQGATPAAGAKPAAGATAMGAQRMISRLLKRHLKGPALTAAKSMFRTVGIKFSREALIRQLPLVNIPANAVVNDMITRRLGAKARGFYSTLPAAPKV